MLSCRARPWGFERSQRQNGEWVLWMVEAEVGGLEVRTLEKRTKRRIERLAAAEERETRRGRVEKR